MNPFSETVDVIVIGAALALGNPLPQELLDVGLYPPDLLPRSPAS